MNIDAPSIARFRQLVELKDFKAPTKKEYVRYVRRLSDHFHADPATLTEEPLRQYFLFLRQHKQFSGSAMSIAKAALQLSTTNDQLAEHLPIGVTRLGLLLPCRPP